MTLSEDGYVALHAQRRRVITSTEPKSHKRHDTSRRSICIIKCTAPLGDEF